MELRQLGAARVIAIRHYREARVVAMAALASLLTLALVFYPKETLEAAKEGIGVFGEIVLPSLFPFFVLSEVLLGLGVVHFMGVIFEPIMRPVFDVPGAGAFALSMGLAAGYPMDAVITGKFRQRGLCTQVEAERLLAFTNTADPLFIFGAVAVGMFGLPALGPLLAAVHYLSSFTVGFIFRFHRRGERGPEIGAEEAGGGMLRRAMRALFRGRREDGRPLGQLLGEAVRESAATLFMIGGFIVVFSVLVRILTVVGMMDLLTPPAAGLLRLLGLSPALVPALFRGLLEIDLGTVAASRAAAPLIQRAVMASAVIAWSGLSVHGQVASVVHRTDIRMGPYVLARLCHAILAGLYTFLLFPFFRLPVFSPPVRYCGAGLARRFILSVWQLALVYGGLTLAVLLLHLGRRYRLVWVGRGRRPA